MRILITGGTGFVGSAIAKKLIESGNEVIITGTRTENAVPGAHLLECHFTGVDWGQLNNIDLVFHEAANNDTLCQDWVEMNHANLNAAQQLFDWLADRGTKKFVYASSTAVYGDGPAPYNESQKLKPLNPYAESKMAFEQWIKEDFLWANPGVTAVGLRYCNVYGPGECHKGKRSSMIRQIAIDMINGKQPRLFKHGEQKRDWIYIDDVVDANITASNYTASGIFNCGSGAASSFNDIVRYISSELYITNVEPEYIDNPNQKEYQIYTECNMSRSRDFLGFVPKYSLAAGIKKYVPFLLGRYS